MLSKHTPLIYTCILGLHNGNSYCFILIIILITCFNYFSCHVGARFRIVRLKNQKTQSQNPGIMTKMGNKFQVLKS